MSAPNAKIRLGCKYSPVFKTLKLITTNKKMIFNFGSYLLHCPFPTEHNILKIEDTRANMFFSAQALLPLQDVCPGTNFEKFFFLTDNEALWPYSKRLD